MKITLINPRENYDVVLPMGILYIATVLELANHQIQILDIGPREQDWPEKIKIFNPDIIGLTLVTTQFGRAKEILSILKTLFPQAKFCAGGTHPSSLPEQTLKDLNLDFVIMGEGEYAMREVCEKISQGQSLAGVKGVCYQENGQIILNEKREPIKNLDELPIPKRELMPDDKWYLIPPGFIRGSFNQGIATIMSGRGCPFNCLFCASHNVFGRGVRRRSPENVIKEIQYLKNNYQIKGLFFLDDTFTIDKNWLRTFCNLLKKENLIWSCQGRGDTIDEEVLGLIKEAGCVQIDIGSESGNDLVLEKLNKMEHVSDLERAFALTKKFNIKTFTSFIVGNPGEGEKEIEDTKKFALRIEPDMSAFCILVPYPGTPVFELAKQNNWFTEAGKNFSVDWSNKQSEHPVMAINFTPQRLLEIRTELENLFFWQNHKIIILSFLKNPRYLGQLLLSMVKNLKATIKTFYTAFKTHKLRLLMEEVYQNFSYEMKIKLAKNEDRS